jgi:hypothetical protein
MKTINALFAKLRDALGVEEVIFLLGIMLLYRGLALQFNHPIAQMVCGGVLILVAMLLTLRSAA